MATKNTDTVKVWQPLALSLMMAVGMLVGYKMNERPQSSLISFSEGDAGAIGQVEELIRFVENRYVDSVDRNVLVERAVESVLSELDPHSVYISPEQLSEVNDEMNGTFRGIGVEIFYIDDTVQIITAVPNGPADRAGIKPYDKLIMIDDSLVAGQSLVFADIRSMLRGDIGTKLKLEVVSRDGATKKTTVLIDDISVSSVKDGVMVDETTGYIKIDRFGSNTYREFMDQFQILTEEEGMKNIIIDLRDNPGGYLPQATNILSQLFKEKGKLLVYTKGNSDRKAEYKSTGKTFFTIDKVAVLIDENSASGSEIIAGAIQDWDRGVIIGRRSFGKGLVQEQYPLSNGGALRLTVARYYTPSGRSIQRTYNDMGSYYSDYEERYYAGEFFSADSISLGDTTKYETMTLSRPVYGGGGITPDIFVAIDSMQFESLYGEVMNELPQYVFRHLANLPKKLDQENLFEESQIIFEKYMADNKDKKNADALFSIGNSIKDQINQSIIRYTRGELEMYKYSLPNDAFIEAALDYFDSSEKLTDLIQPTSSKS